MIKGNEKVLLLEFRGLGDTIVKTSLLASLARSFPGLKLDLLTRPSFRYIFEKNPHINKVYFGELPILKRDAFNSKYARDFLNSLIRLCKNKYDISLNTVGDFRENIIGHLVCPQKNISVLW